MSGGANTTTQIGASRTAASLRREERRGFAIFGMSPLSHLVILGLAALIWWIARGMVNQTLTVDNAAGVTFTMSESLRSEWVIVPPRNPPTVSIDLSGPNAEVSRFASTLTANRGVFRYTYNIKPQDVAQLEVDRSLQATLEVELSEFKEEGESLRPAEVRILPPAPGRKQSVRLEKIVRSDALILVNERITGEVSGHSVTAKVQDGFELEVSGPASRVRELSNEDGRPLLRIVSVNVGQLVATKAQVERKEREIILREGFTENIDLVAVDGVVIRRKGTDAPVSQVPLRFTFETPRDWAQPPGITMAPSVRLASWMVEKGVRVEGLPAGVTVVMQVLRPLVPEFNDKNVSVVLDLSRVQFSELKNVEAPEGGGPGVRRARLSGLDYSLDVAFEKGTYRFARSDVSERRYLPAEEIRLVWEE